jgi:hypothetical protein
MNIVYVLVGAAAIGAVYEIEGRHDAAAERRDLLRAEIAEARRDIHVLKAEWSYQTRPARLQALAEEHLLLRPTEPDRLLADPAALPSVIERMDGVVEARTGEARQ